MSFDPADARGKKAFSLRSSFDPGAAQDHKYPTPASKCTKSIMDPSLFRVLSDTVGRSFQSPQPQDVTLGEYTIRTSAPSARYPFFFTATVVSGDMSVDFGIWQSDRHEGKKFRPLVTQANFVSIGGHKWHTIPRPSKYDSIRQKVSDIHSCLRLVRVEV